MRKNKKLYVLTLLISLVLIINTSFVLANPNNPPNQPTDPTPEHEATDIQINPWLIVNVSDPDEDEMTVTFYNAYNDSIIGIDYNVTSGQSADTIWYGLDYNTKYEWYAIANDGINSTQSNFWNFTTEPINTAVDAISPYEQTSSPLTINATGPSDLSNVTLWYHYSSDNATWWNISWIYREKLTIDSSQVTGDLTNFPILVSITDGNLSSKAQSDGDDIVFTDDTGIKLNHEIELFNDITGELIAWVNITDLKSSTNTDFYMYYGNSNCGSQENPIGVWDSDYIAVWHMDGADDTIVKDSTDVYHSVNHICDSVTGKIGKGRDLDSSNSEYISFGDMAQPCDDSLNVGFIEYWSSQGATSSIIMAKYDTFYEPDEISYYTQTLSTGEVRSRVYAGTTLNRWGYITDNAEANVDGTWTHIAMAYQFASETMTIYINGSSVAVTKEADAGSGPTAWDNTVTADCVGRIRTEGGGGTYSFYSVAVDEVRYSKTVRSADWISTCFNTMNNPITFLITGIEESWISWSDPSNPDTASPWSWSFNFPNGLGYYEFYSIGQKSGSIDETAPNSADAICRYMSDSPNNPPYTPSNPSPSSGAINQDINVDLSWTGGDPDPGDTVTYDVYFEADDPTPDVLVSDDQTNTSYDPGPLNYSTQYYWKIVAKDNHEATTEGPIWNFTTEAENIPPIANAGSDQEITDYNGNGEETVTLDGTNSNDPDGYIISYEWKEGEILLGTLETITPTLSIGTHNITLKVTDNKNATDTDNITIIIEPGEIHVENIDMTLEKSAPDCRAIATVLIYDQNGTAKEGAIVIGDWYFEEELIQTGASDTTDATGNAYIYSPWKKAKKGETFTFIVTNVELNYYIYNSSANVETEDSITV